MQEEAEEEFRQKRAAIEAELEEKTAKKRAKRQKKKGVCCGARVSLRCFHIWFTDWLVILYRKRRARGRKARAATDRRTAAAAAAVRAKATATVLRIREPQSRREKLLVRHPAATRVTRDSEYWGTVGPEAD